MNKALYDMVTKGEHHRFRREITESWYEALHWADKPPARRMAERFCRLMALETPHILPGEQIVFLRTTQNLPPLFSDTEWADIRKTHFIHELGFVSNLSPDYASVLQKGLEETARTAGPEARKMIGAILNLSDRYRDEARRIGREDVAQVLERVPRKRARTFREALQAFRIFHFSLWLEGNYHITVGRFDQYMYPYLKGDLEQGTLNETEALALLEDFFLSFHKDNDLYPGIQQGDNGQSMVLGGVDREGKPCFNLLSKLCLQASANLKRIDPKINLRVDRHTPLEVYELGSRLTREGLGFPQYSNDEVVIPALVKLGYSLADARDYTVAACWEFIIPKVGRDVPNIAALSFPKVIDRAFHQSLTGAASFEDFLAAVKQEIQKEAGTLCSQTGSLWFVPSPLLETVLGEAKYQNFGMHGTGLSTAADCLAAIKRLVFEEQAISPEDYISAVDSDFQSAPALLHLLRYELPKLGQNTGEPEKLAAWLLNTFSQALEGKRNCFGGRWRAGTGSAMYYLWHAAELGASPDGRRKGEAFGANLAPSLFAKAGPISVTQSFCQLPFEGVCNGGPLTMEFHSGMFTGEESIRKLALFVKSYLDQGGHQLQLNAVNGEKLRRAQLHPEEYPHLVVRVWGWSAYFTELDQGYQNHIIARKAYEV